MSRRAALLRLALLAAVLAGCVVVLATSGSLSAQRVRDWVDGYGAAGPVVFVALSSLLTVVLFPG
ncbi:MAG: TVP38/TMEM64 family protein, partial [Solirubrobacteraceae bacterium]